MLLCRLYFHLRINLTTQKTGDIIIKHQTANKLTIFTLTVTHIKLTKWVAPGFQFGGGGPLCAPFPIMPTPPCAYALIKLLKGKKINPHLFVPL